MWDGEYTVGLQHLKLCNYLPAECEQIQSLSDRIGRVYSDSLFGDSQKSVAVIGEAESTLFKCCG
ncbi:hypothetical protein [Nostoc sp.]|uniref:hypothetical protein n=1 Tax=Nostoc sp. TaxID=1180 RepID=UPI002FF7AA6A